MKNGYLNKIGGNNDDRNQNSKSEGYLTLQNKYEKIFGKLPPSNLDSFEKLYPSMLKILANYDFESTESSLISLR